MMSARVPCGPLIALTLAIGLPAVRGEAQDSTANQCLTCHASQQDARIAAPAALFSGADVHRERGFACIDCHGGNAGAADKTAAHDASRGFKGAPRGPVQIAACARCHSDADLMRRFAPRQRIDQAAEYATSVHGKQLARGDTRVATCASCHGAHGVRPVGDAKSPVFPTNVARTCATCHADAVLMRSYTLPGGAPLPTTQSADYQRSVHAAALASGRDLSAATCNDCHGNHGAAPPGAGTVANVCGTCHPIYAEKFRASLHSEIFDRGCVECHSNHAVLRPSDDMLGSTKGAVCAECHSGADDKGAARADAMHRQLVGLKDHIGRSTALIERVRNAGIEVSDQELALRDALERLTRARTEMHAADRAAVEPIIDEGLKIVGAVDAKGQEGLAELRFRRRGLGFSLAAILIVVGALALKVRRLDRHRGVGSR